MASSPQCGLVSYRLVNSTWLANESEALCTYLTFHDTVALLLAAAFLVALALSLPCGKGREGLPVGLQIAGPRFADALVLQLAWHAEQLLGTAAPSPLMDS